MKKVKCSIRRAQPAHSSKPNRDSVAFQRLQKVIHFSQARGKVLEDVEFSTSHDYDAVILSFQDKTCLTLAIQTCFSMQAEYLDRKTGDHRVLKRWPPLHTVRFRSKE